MFRNILIPTDRSKLSHSVHRAAVAGTAGGTVEVLWIGLATAALGMEGSQVAGAVAATIVPASANWAWAPSLGLAVHFLFSFALAVLFMRVTANRLRGAALLIAAITVLGLVWAFNFFVLLPVLNPAFPALLPHPVTLVSKLLFGLAMALVLGGAGIRTATPFSLRLRRQHHAR